MYILRGARLESTLLLFTCLKAFHKKRIFMDKLYTSILLLDRDLNKNRKKLCQQLRSRIERGPFLESVQFMRLIRRFLPASIYAWFLGGAV